MSKRMIAFVGGLLVGALLRATLMQPEPAQPASSTAASAAASARCAAHPVKMPCLFDDSGHKAGREIMAHAGPD